MISMTLIVQLVVAGLIFAVLWWGLQQIGMPEPVGMVLRVLLILMIVLFLVNLLMGIGGRPLFRY